MWSLEINNEQTEKEEVFHTCFLLISLPPYLFLNFTPSPFLSVLIQKKGKATSLS